MSTTSISPSVFHFLKTLKKNNNREWFTENKPEFKELESQVKSFFESVSEKMGIHDEIERLKLFRIYRDVRFSHDKTPYKTSFSGSMSRAGAHLRGGYYMHLEPGATMIAAGFWNPNKEDLFRIRKEWELDAQELRKLLASSKFKKVWGQLQGEEVKTAPKGFDKTDPNIDLIRKKQFIFIKKFTDKEVHAADFDTKIDQSFQAIRPYFDLMSNILTTNLNGESLLV